MNKFLIILIFVLSPLVVSAQASTVGSMADLLTLPIDNFGGRVLFTVPCSCPIFPGFVMYVLDPRLISVGNLGNLTAIKDVASLKKAGMDSMVKKIKVVPFIFSRINLNYMPTPGNFVLGTHLSVKSITGSLKLLQKIPALSNLSTGKSADYFTGCYQYAVITCIPVGDPTSDGVVTPWPLSGMGTSLRPI